MFDIESIQEMYSKRGVVVRKHFHERIKEREIKHNDIRSCIMGGEIIEQDLNDEPNPTVLILGHSPSGEPLHVAVGVDDDKIHLITTYWPTLDIWEADYKTRRSQT